MDLSRAIEPPGGGPAMEPEAHLAALRRLLERLRASKPTATLMRLLEAMERSVDDAGRPED